MHRSSTLVVALLLCATPTAFAQTSAAEHAAHHPASAPAPSKSASAPAAAAGMAMMDTHMQRMREMRDKMMAARSPEERRTLMAEHMRLMREGMSMMGGMSAKTAPKGQADMASRHAQMEKRMEMMQSMMEMMMDRMSLEKAQ